MLERGEEAVVADRPGEVAEAGPAAGVVRDGEVERVDHRQDAEHDEERQVRHDEREAARGAQATLACRVACARTALLSGCLHLVTAGRPCIRRPVPPGRGRRPTVACSELSDLPATSWVTTVLDQTGWSGYVTRFQPDQIWLAAALSAGVGSAAKYGLVAWAASQSSARGA